jgi:hypothetical protein
VSSSDEPAPAASVAIVPLSGDQLASAGHVFASSDADYPSWRAVFPDCRQRERALRVLFEATVRDSLPFGAVDAAVANGQVLGIAVWLPPGRSSVECVAQAQGGAGDARCAACRARPLSHVRPCGRQRRAFPPDVPAVEPGDARHPTSGTRPRDRQPAHGPLPCPGPSRRPALPFDNGKTRESRSTSGSALRSRTTRCRLFPVDQPIGACGGRRRPRRDHHPESRRTRTQRTDQIVSMSRRAGSPRTE